MSFTRRAIAALSGLLLLQLMLLGSGTLCAIQHGAMHRSNSADEMQMASMRQHANAHGTAVASVDDGDMPMNPAGGGDGCQVPLIPGQCGSMSTCTISATPSEMVTAPTSLRVIALALAPATQDHRSPTFTPELPPPRA